MNSKILIFGYGYSAGYIAEELSRKRYNIFGTVRDQQKIEQYNGDATLVDFKQETVAAILSQVDHLIISIPPSGQKLVSNDEKLNQVQDNTQTSQDIPSVIVDRKPEPREASQEVDLVLANFRAEIKKNAGHIKSVTYLSTTGVYGDHKGAWVDEQTLPNPGNERSKLRLRADDDWREFCKANEMQLNILRLSGIYGPGRSALERLRNGQAKSIHKEGQVFSRIHVEDIARTVSAIIERAENENRKDLFEIYNLADDLPASSLEVNLFAAKLLGMPAPKVIDYKDAELSPMAKEFYRECRRVRNKKIKEQLGIDLKYPSYKKGLLAMVSLDIVEKY